MVTVKQPEETPASTEEATAAAAPEQEEEARAAEQPAEESASAAEDQKESAGAEPVELISDSMHVRLPAEEPAAPLMAFAAPAANAAPAVALSEDNQWITGLTSDMEYITAETYAAQGGEAANNAWWTKLRGGARADGSKYSPAGLTDGKMEVLSAWYGRTVYVRYQGQSGQGTAIEVPAYTDPSYQSGNSFLYKNAIKVLNAWVPDTGGSFYSAYLNVMIPNGDTPNGGHITIDTIPITTFNSNSKAMLTNAEGDYIYDAVIIGAATGDEPDLSGAAAWVLADYIDQGYGFMIGHDMIYGYGGIAANPNYVPDPNSTVTPYYKLNTLENGHYNMAWLMGRNEHYSTANPYSAASMILCGGDYRDKSTLYGDNSGTSLLEIRKSGEGDPLTNFAARTPTNYPFTQRYDGVPFGVGNQFYGTPTHTNQQVAYGTVWIDYASNGLTSMGAGRLIADTKSDGLAGTNNFYLTTNGNLAMNQIGHTKGNKDIVKIDECYILANTLFYISQRQQCQVCQSQQGGNDQIHIVRKIRSAEELANLNNPDMWFTFPLDGCYMLTNDITLPADWQPIEGFDGHFDADGHSIRFAAGLPEENQRVFATAGDGWALGEDKTQGVNAVYAGAAKTTGVARVVGYLSALLGDADSWQGYRVEIDGTDGVTYSCITNRDGKYVISNLPVTGVMEARVYDAAGHECTDLGTLAVTIPDGTGLETPEGRSQDFWLSAETTAIYPLGYSALPPEPIVRWVGQNGEMTATIVTNTEYPEDRIIWQYNDGSGWHDLEGSGIEHFVTHIGQVDTGDTLTTGTQTRLTLENLPLSLDGLEVRIKYKNSQAKDAVSASATVTVRKPELKLSMSGGQTVYVAATTAAGALLDYAIPASQWPAQVGKSYPDAYKTENNGNNQAAYTSEILYLPQLDDRNIPQITWAYRSSNFSAQEITFSTSQYAVGKWTTVLDDASLKQAHPHLSFSVTVSQPVACDASGKETSTGEWRKVISTLLVDGADVSMDVGNTHFFFRCMAQNTYGSGNALYTGKASSSDADLNVSYSVDIIPNKGTAVFGNGQATWTFPDLEVIAPNGLRMVVLTYCKQGHNTANRIVMQQGNPYGITVEFDGGDYLVLRSGNGSLITQERWQEFLRRYISFVTYDVKDADPNDISWYVSENDASENYKVNLFDGTTAGWTAETQNFLWYGHAGGMWGAEGYNTTNSYSGPLVSGGKLMLTVQSGTSSLGRYYTSEDWSDFWLTRGYYMALKKAVNVTGLSKIVLQTETAATNTQSWGDTNAVFSRSVLVGNQPAPVSGSVFDVSSFTGDATISLVCKADVRYIANGKNGTAWLECLGNQETSSIAVTQAVGLSTSFSRTSHSAVQYSEIYANKVDTTISATVALTPDPRKVYDGQPSKAVLTITAADGSESVILAGCSGVQYAKNGSLVDSCVDQGVYTASVTFEQGILDQYDLKGVNSQGIITATIQIDPRPLYLQGKYLDDPAEPANIKAYDGTNEATISNIKINNIVPGDKVTVDKSLYAGVYSTANAGETLNPDGTAQENRYAKLIENQITRTEKIQLVNNPERNYYIAGEEYSGAIYRRTISAFVGHFSSVYGESPALEPTTEQIYTSTEGGDTTDLRISSLVASDVLTIDPAKSHFVLPRVDASSDAGVYEIGYEGLTEGNYPVLKNYIVWYQPGTLTIGPRPLIIRAGEYSKVYGDPLPAFAPVYEGFILGDTAEESLTGEAVLASEADAESPAGEYEVTVAGLDCRENENGAYNYTVQFQSGALTIGPRPLVIRAGEYSKVYGDPLPAFAPIYEGFILGDTAEESLIGEAVFDCEADAKSPVGNYGVTVSGLDCGENVKGAFNYTIYYRPGNLEVTKRPIIITPDPGEEPEEPVAVTPTSNVAVTKKVDKSVLAVGETASYTIIVTNTGTIELTNLSIKDTHNGAGVINATVGQGYTYDGNGNFTIIRLPVGKSVTIAYTYTAQKADAGKTLTNIAVAKVPGTNPPDPDDPSKGTDPTKPIDPDKEVPSNPVDVLVDPEKEPDPNPDPQPEAGRSIHLTKIPDVAFAKPGDIIIYTVVVTNDGTEDLINVLVRDKPQNFTGELEAVPAKGYTIADGVCIIDSLPVGASVTLHFTYLVQEADAGRNLRNVVVGVIPGTNLPDPTNPDNGMDPTKPIDPDKEVPSNEAVVPVDPISGVAADPQWKLYGDEDPELTFTLPEELVNPGDIWGELERVPGEIVGSYIILQGSLASENYDITFIPNYLFIKPAPLTIQADNKGRPAKTANPTFTVSYEGFKFDDGPDDLEGELIISCPADLESEPGGYPITATGLYSKNYDITWLPGILTIWSYVDELAVGVIEVDRPGSNSRFGDGKVVKEYPQTGDGDGTVSKSWSTTDEDAAPLLIIENGRLYLRKSKEVKVNAQTEIEEKVYNNLTEESVPESIIVIRDGTEQEMQLASVDYTSAHGTFIAEEALDHGYLISAPDAPEEKEITYTDPETGLVQTVRGQLVSTEQTEPYTWRKVEFPIRYFGEESYEIFQLDDTYVAYDPSAPQWQGLDALVLEVIGLPVEQYRLTGSEWTSDWTLNESGRSVRHGVIYGEMLAARWVSTYRAKTELPLYNAKATYVVPGESESLIIAEYAPISMAMALTLASVGVALLVLAIIVFLLLLKRKRKGAEKDSAQHNTVH